MGLKKNNVVNIPKPRGSEKSSGKKIREKIFMAAGGLVVFVFTILIYGIIEEPEGPGQERVVTDNRDILAQIELMEEEQERNREKLGMIKNDIFLGKKTDVDEYTERLLNDMKKNISEERSGAGGGNDLFNGAEPVGTEGNHLDAVLAYLEKEDDGPGTMGIPTPSRPKVAPVSEKKRAQVKPVPSLIAFSNSQPSARIYHDGGRNIPFRRDHGAVNGRGGTGKPSLIFNSNPVFTIFEGEYISASLTGQVVNDKRDSPVTAVVTRDLLDVNGRFVLIPAHAKIMGRARKVSAQQDNRVFIDFHRIILPNGRSLNMGSADNRLSAMDRSGALGIRGKKNNHFFSRFGSSILYGSLNGLSGLAQNRLDQTSGVSRFLDRTSDNFNMLNNRLASDSLSIVPTITIRSGTEVKVRFSSDVKISAWCRVSDRPYYGEGRG